MSAAAELRDAATRLRDRLADIRVAEDAAATAVGLAHARVERAAAAAHAAEDGLLTARAAELASGQAHQAAKEFAATEKRRADLEQHSVLQAKAREAELRGRKSAATVTAQAAVVEAQTRRDMVRETGLLRAAHEASPRRHRVSLYDHAPCAVPQTTYPYAASAAAAVDHAIASSPGRRRIGPPPTYLP